MSIYSESLLTSRLDVSSVKNLAMKPFIDMVYNVFSEPHYIFANGLIASKLIVPCQMIEWQGLCVDVAKIYDKNITTKNERYLCEKLIKLSQMSENVVNMTSRKMTGRGELRKQFVVNTLSYMGMMVSQLSIERGKMLDELEKDTTDPLV